jgi:hypothetical protein
MVGIGTGRGDEPRVSAFLRFFSWGGGGVKIEQINKREGTLPTITNIKPDVINPVFKCVAPPLCRHS